MEDLFFGYVGLAIAFLSILCAVVSLIAARPIWKEDKKKEPQK